MDKRRDVEEEKHDRWLVSYADFITLLFAFFVVLFASSQTDKAKAQAVAEAVSDAFEHGSAMKKLAEILGGAPDDLGRGSAGMRGPGGSKTSGPAAAQVLQASYEILQKDLRAEINSGSIRVNMTPRGLVVSLQQAAFFPSGGDQVSTLTLPSLGKIASVLSALPNQIRLEGHTDSLPIHTGRFRSNWDLASSRGISVLELLEAAHGIPRSRMAVVAYADTIAIADNATEEGRARNRRVDIVVLSEMAGAQEPLKRGRRSAASS
ncbi:MAG TPA: flagellar motor protein MotB [Bryobacteraceae bacterium]|nr:flagellar motor protein MotB [Bryobacteraceae bacterium]